MTVIKAEDGTFSVRSGEKVVIGGFGSSADAWRWIDRHDGDPISPAEKKSSWVVSRILGGAGEGRPQVTPLPSKRRNRRRRRAA